MLEGPNPIAMHDTEVDFLFSEKEISKKEISLHESRLFTSKPTVYANNLALFWPLTDFIKKK